MHYAASDVVHLLPPLGLLEKDLVNEGRLDAYQRCLAYLPMGTKKIPGSEEIRKLCLMPWEAAIATRYRRVLDHRDFPPTA